MEIRLAVSADEDAVCRLWSMLLEFYHKQAVPRVLQRSFRYAIGHPRKIRIFIISINGVVTGTASLQLGHYSTWNNTWYGHIEDVIVDPAYRNRGLATALVKHAIKTAEENNLSRVELNVLANNHAARRIYERLGLTTNSMAYELHFPHIPHAPKGSG
ncbi:MAG TPA: GNAT family N-acetyltransferase [Candidatus Limnocylindrales bacterium]|nr:GNAT family N-acetyltransferase [Candidatus Limnocylindrales bacterium]